MRRRIQGKWIALALAVTVLAAAAPAWAAFQALPSDGSQVNNDSTAGIDPTKDAGEADIVGGALTAGKVAVPWATFEQKTSTQQQVFVRAFKDGAWTTQGTGTVGGKPGGTLSGSLNFDQATDGEAPAIDFAGAGRTVPWASWYEATSAFTGKENIFASRFDPTQTKWIFAGQSRGVGTGATPVPSLNIHTNQDAENPSVAGGSAADPTKPGPWVTWQEKTTAPVQANGNFQIFVEKPVGPAAPNCTGVKPAANDPSAAPIGGFCWQQVGTERVGPGSADPSLNVDPTRDGIEPDIAFTGSNDAVPWVVWYEQGASGIGLNGNEMVFAAKGVSDTTAGTDGGFHWQVVGQPGGGGQLDLTGATNHFGPCAETVAAEKNCSINKNGDNAAEDPRIAAGTMNPATPTVPWIVWDEDVGGGKTQIFVARLVGGDHFEIANNGAPISLDSNPSTRPDITFSGNTPYVSWRENTGGTVDKEFVGHFVNAANPTFQLDQSNIDISQTDLRAPISSGCTANPFNQDGAACQSGAIGTPFFAFLNGSSPMKLFAQAYQSDVPLPLSAASTVSGGVTLTASVNPQGAAVKAHFDFGATTAYGSSTADQVVGVANAATTFNGAVSGLPANTVIHYRPVVVTDFGAVAGADQTFQTPPAPGGGGGGGGGGNNPPPDTTKPTAKLVFSKLKLSALKAKGKLNFKVTVSEASKAKLSASNVVVVKKKKHTTKLGSASGKFTKKGSKTLTIKLSKAGKKSLKGLSKATIVVTATVVDTAGNKTTKHLTLKLKN